MLKTSLRQFKMFVKTYDWENLDEYKTPYFVCYGHPLGEKWRNFTLGDIN
jgi:hypothetical protein